MLLKMKPRMAHNRVRDDVGEYRQALLESTGPSRYMLNLPRARTRSTPITSDPRASVQGFPVAHCSKMSLIDADSELLGITRRLGLCDASKYDPRRDGDMCRAVASGLHVPLNQPTDLDSEDCRMSNPPCTLRGTGINRFEWLCRDPQETALPPFGTPVEERRMAKDNHRPLVESPIRDGAVPPAPASGYAPGIGCVEIGKDIETAVSEYPPILTTQHWRDAREVEMIVNGWCA